MACALYSIKKEYSTLILSGVKSIEFRKYAASKHLDKLYIYESRGLGKIVGEVFVEKTVTCPLEYAWKLGAKRGCISKQYFESYYSGKSSATLIYLGECSSYETPISLKEIGVSRPPQSFCYLTDLQCSYLSSQPQRPVCKA